MFASVASSPDFAVLFSSRWAGKSFLNAIDRQRFENRRSKEMEIVAGWLRAYALDQAWINTASV